jgi:hypothetical protein
MPEHTEEKWYVFVYEAPNRRYVPFQTDSLTNPKLEHASRLRVLAARLATARSGGR